MTWTWIPYAFLAAVCCVSAFELRWQRLHPEEADCVFCGHHGPVKDHAGTGDMVCADDGACLARGYQPRDAEAREKAERSERLAFPGDWPAAIIYSCGCVTTWPAPAKRSHCPRHEASDRSWREWEKQMGSHS